MKNNKRKSPMKRMKSKINPFPVIVFSLFEVGLRTDEGVLSVLTSSELLSSSLFFPKRFFKIKVDFSSDLRLVNVA